ncbi:B-lymphocyte antigen CD19 [Candoia aspera]|uniref:B-lymphocyte antigen CD19 n=1 Tax=Candoia aspera TaxID=51853 RepID=UPI002FD7DCFA
MAPVLCYLLLLWLTSWIAATEAPRETMQLVQVTESQEVSLSCILDHALASRDLDLIWLGPKRKELLYVNVRYHQPEADLNAMWGLLIHRTSVQNTTWLTCEWNGMSGKPHVLPNNTRHQEDFPHSVDPKYFHCDAPVHRNWTQGTLLWIQHDSPDQNAVLINMTIWRSVRYSLDMNASFVSLILPSVTFEDAGNYSCQWKNQTCHFQLEVIANKVVWYWMIWSVALGYMVVCLGSLSCFLWLWRVHRARARRQQMKLRSPAKRRYFCAKQKKRYISNKTVVSPANDNVTEQVDAFSYENVLPDMGAQHGQRLLQKGKILPNTLNMEDEEEYECPDSEIELKSDDDENYENTQEEVKQGDVVLSDVLIYENNKDKVISNFHSGNSVDSWYSNKTQQILENLTQDQEPIAEDNENYINLEEECPLSPGAARLIAGLRLQLALDPHIDRQDGGSEPSTGSQSYEEMNGSLCPTASRLLHLHANTSNEEDADSYENMESPTSVNSWRECTLDPHGEGVHFGSRWQHISVPFGVDLRVGCSAQTNIAIAWDQAGRNSFPL